MTYNDGTIYDGDWVNGTKEGHGTENSKSSVYTGTWKNNQKHGKGELIWGKNRELHYNGTFVYDVKQGQGRCTLPDGSTYDGAWNND